MKLTALHNPTDYYFKSFIIGIFWFFLEIKISVLFFGDMTCTQSIKFRWFAWGGEGFQDVEGICAVLDNILLAGKVSVISSLSLIITVS